MSFAEHRKIATYFGMAIIGIPSAAIVIAGSLGVFDSDPIPDDPDLAVFLQTNFPEIRQALETSGQNIVTYPPEERIDEIHNLMLQNEGQGDYLRLGSMGDAADLFNEVASDGLYIRAVRCDAQTEDSDIYDCRFVLAERGGIVGSGRESLAEVPACSINSYSAVVSVQGGNISYSLHQGDASQYVHRIDPARALDGHVDMDQFSEENPHKGPEDFDQITLSSHVYFHTAALRNGVFSLSALNTLLGEDQLAAEKVLARFSECIKGAEPPAPE